MTSEQKLSHLITGVFALGLTVFSQDSQVRDPYTCDQEVSGAKSLIAHPLGKSIKEDGFQIITLSPESLRSRQLIEFRSVDPSCARTAVLVQYYDNTISVNGHFYHPSIEPANWTWGVAYDVEDFGGNYSPSIEVRWSQSRITGFFLK